MAALEARDVATIGVDLVPLRDLSIVRDLVALTQALHHLGDRTAWLAVLRAPWCGASLASLTVLSRRGDKQLLWEALADTRRLSECPATDRARLQRLRAVLESALAARNDAPLAEWLEATWVSLGAPDAYAAGELRHARAFLTALGDRVAAGEWRGPRDLDSLLADLYAQPHTPAANPVQLMTIHRAKGLEFDHVFVPALDRDLGRGREPLLRWLDLPRAHGVSDLIMAPVPAISSDGRGELSTLVKRLTARRGANEQVRLLYVAATRARCSLYLSAAPRSRPDGSLAPRSGTSLAMLWPALGADFVLPSDAVPVTPPDPGALSLQRLAASWAPPTLAAPLTFSRLPVAHRSLESLEFSWVQETARCIGTVIHGALERLASHPELPSPDAIESQRAAYLSRLQRLGVPERELPRAAGVVVEALRGTISDPRGRWLFSTEHQQAHSELALTGMANGRLTGVVIDRCFVDRDGIRWVVDFKTSRHEGGGLEAFLESEMQRYRGQLASYVTLAGALGPQPVRAALYFPLLRAFREL
jgi:ATP-dependent exoDNAse (exonuclease V) beta subunit